MAKKSFRMYICKICVYQDNAKTGKLLEEREVNYTIGYSKDIEEFWERAYKYYSGLYEKQIAIHMLIKMN